MAFPKGTKAWDTNCFSGIWGLVAIFCAYLDAITLSLPLFHFEGRSLGMLLSGLILVQAIYLGFLILSDWKNEQWELGDVLSPGWSDLEVRGPGPVCHALILSVCIAVSLEGLPLVLPLVCVETWWGLWEDWTGKFWCFDLPYIQSEGQMEGHWGGIGQACHIWGCSSRSGEHLTRHYSLQTLSCREIDAILLTGRGCCMGLMLYVRFVFIKLEYCYQLRVCYSIYINEGPCDFSPLQSRPLVPSNGRIWVISEK